MVTHEILVGRFERAWFTMLVQGRALEALALRVRFWRWMRRRLDNVRVCNGCR